MRKTSLLLIAICFAMFSNAQVSKTLNVTAGGLSAALTIAEKNTITNLTLIGTIDARDFKTMRDNLPLLSFLDLSGTNIVAYTGTEGGVMAENPLNYPANTIPIEAFYNSYTNRGKGTLNSILLPITITRIDDFAFGGCWGLTSINIPSLVSSIGDQAFAFCRGLNLITIPSSVNLIGRLAFAYCDKLNKIILESSNPINLTNSLYVFDSCDLANCKLYVPFGSLGLFANADQWRDFKNIIEMPGFYFSKTSITLEPAQGSLVSIEISSNITWSASSDKSWLKISPISGYGVQTLSFIAEENSSQSIRTATVTFSANGVKPRSIIVSQKTSKLQANAGENQTVIEGSTITLNGLLSSVGNGNPITYKWTAPDGITLSSTSEPNPTFIAPNVMYDTDYTFFLVVNDGMMDSPADEVTITVKQINLIQTREVTIDYKYNLFDSIIYIEFNITYNNDYPKEQKSLEFFFDRNNNGEIDPFYDRAYFFFADYANEESANNCGRYITNIGVTDYGAFNSNGWYSYSDDFNYVSYNFPINEISDQDSISLTARSFWGYYPSSDFSKVLKIPIPDNILNIGNVISEKVSEITQNSCVLGGILHSKGNSIINEKGIVWSTNKKIDIKKNLGKIIINSDSLSFNVRIDSLKPNSLYFYRAYAILDDIPIYGNLVSFKTEIDSSKFNFLDDNLVISNSGKNLIALLSEEDFSSWQMGSSYELRSSIINSLYGQIMDDFDFIFFVDNSDGLAPGNTTAGISYNASSYHEDGTTEKLKSLIWLPARGLFKTGPTLHEMMHTWANSSFYSRALVKDSLSPTGLKEIKYGAWEEGDTLSNGHHWGVSTVGGQLGGFDKLITNVDDESNKFQGIMKNKPGFGQNVNGGNSLPYSNLELYLMGVLPPDEVLPVKFFYKLSAKNKEEFYNEGKFYSDSVVTFDSEKIKRIAGNPDYKVSQKEFKALIILVSHTIPTSKEIEEIDQYSTWFANPNYDNEPDLCNFYEATGGRATIVLDDYRLNKLPIADAGNNQTVNEGTFVTLDGSKSFDPDKNTLTYKWSSKNGFLINNPNTANPSFNTLNFISDTTLVFTLIVNDGLIDSKPKTVNVTIKLIPITKNYKSNAGALKTSLSIKELNSISKLKLTGTVDARDFKTMRDNMPLLTELDLSEAKIVGYSGTEGTAGKGIITYPANEVPANAFSNKTSLISINLPLSITSIGNFALVGCSNLSTISEFPSSLNSIGSSALKGCNGFITVDSKNPNYSSIDGVLFNKSQTTLIYCSPSKSGNYNIPATVTYIDNYAFYNCKNLTSVTIPTSVTWTGGGLFMYCYGLEKVSILAPRFYIDDKYNFLQGLFFWGCSSLSSLYLNMKTPPSLVPLDTQTGSQLNAFGGVDKTTCKLFVPMGSKQLYAKADQWKDFYNIIEMPLAHAGADQSVNEGTNVSLDGSKSTDPNGKPLTYKWTAPAGITLSSTTVAKPTFTAPAVTQNTSYTFSLVVNDGTLDSPVDQVVVIVKNVNKAPVANAGSDQSVNEGATVSLDGSLSSDADGNPLTYKWTAPAGITLSSTTTAKPTFTAPEVSINTNYTFSLIVNDGTVDSPADQLVATVKNVNKAPVANTGADQLVNEGATVTLDGSLSSDLDGNPLTYKWTATAGITLSSTTAAKPTFTAPEVSTNTNYTFSLVVNDGTVDSPADQVVVTVKNVNKTPVANAGVDQSVNEETVVSLDGSASSDPDANPLTYKWTAPAGITLSSTTIAKPTFTAPAVTQNTSYTFSLIVNDGTVNSPIDQMVVTVKNVNKAPVTNAGLDQSVNEGATVFLDGSLSSDADGNPLTYKWTAPVGITLSSTTIERPTFTAPAVIQNTSYTISLIVNDGTVDSPIDQVVVTVKKVNKAPVANAGLDQSVNEEATVFLDGSLSSDSDGNPLTYKWTAPAGITLSSTIVAKPTFIAPEVKRDSILSFSLIVSDGMENSVPAIVKITVLNFIKVGNSEIPTQAFKVYPNPTTGMITLEFTQSKGKKTEISVSNLIGAEVFRKEFEVAEKFEVDLSNQVSGIYLLKVIIDNQQYISKIVIKKE
jgi:hypothetical protein